MSHKVLPLDERGYGRLISETSRGALALWQHLRERDFGAFRLVLLPEPDLNIVCFAVAHPKLQSLEAANAFVDRLYAAMSIQPENDSRRLDYFVTKTVLRCGEYGSSIDPLAEALGFDAAECLAAGGVSVIRCTLMDPFVASRRGEVDYIEGFATNLETILTRELDAVAS